MPKYRINPKIRYYGDRRLSQAFFYHNLLSINNALFFGLLLFAFVGVNTLFSLAYFFSGGLFDTIHIGDAVHYVDALYVSMTFPVVGYGGIAPTGWGKLIAAIHVFTILVFLGTITGIIFARFSQGRSPLIWSKPLVLHALGKDKFVQMRVTNLVGNDVVDVIARLYLQRQTKNRSGELIRQLIPIETETPNIPITALTWIISHRISSKSPLKHWVQGQAPQNEQLVGFIVGLDSTLGRSIYSFAKWKPEDLQCGTFDTMITKYEETEHLQPLVDIDLSKIDSVVQEQCTR